MADVEPTDGQVMAGAVAIAGMSLEAPTPQDAWNSYAAESQRQFVRLSRGVLEAALNFEEPYTTEDEKYDFALKTTDEISGNGTYAAVNLGSDNPMVQRAIKRWKEKQ